MLKVYVDTNVILRFLLNDPLEMAEKAAQVFEAAEKGEVTLVVNVMVIAEAIWVLQSFYKQSIPAIAKVITDFILNEGILVEDKVTLLSALQLYEIKRIDFIDAWLASTMQQQGIQQIFSFDEHFDRVAEIKRLEPGK